MNGPGSSNCLRLEVALQWGVIDDRVVEDVKRLAKERVLKSLVAIEDPPADRGIAPWTLVGVRDTHLD